MIRVVFKDGETYEWAQGDYTGYQCDGTNLCIYRNGNLEGYYDVCLLGSVSIDYQAERGKGNGKD